MGKRFGRNQRRKLQEAIYRAQFIEAETSRRLINVLRERDQARDEARNAVDVAFQRFLAEGDRVEHLLKIIAKTLGGALAEGIRPVAEQILQAQRERPDFDARADFDNLASREIVILRGRIPTIEYNIAVW